MGRIYISYSSKDKKFVSWLVTRLKQENIEIWYDQSELYAGDVIKEKIIEGIKTSSLFLIVLSKESSLSKWVYYELNTALIYNAQKHGVRLVPILIDDDFIIPSSLSGIKYADFRRDNETAIQELIRVIHLTEHRYLQAPNWQKLSPMVFEDLVYDLLIREGLQDVVRNGSLRDHGFDFIGYYSRELSGNMVVKEKWIIEAKYYKNSKISVQTIANLYGTAKLSVADTILIVTNSSLTRSAKNFMAERILDINVLVWDESFLLDLLTKYSDIQKKYFSSDVIDKEKTVTIYDEELSKVQRLISKLKDCPEGKDGWKEYENVCIEILNHLFVPPLKEPRIQSRTESGIDIRDAIYPNRGNHENWGFIRNDYDAKYIIFEFKNYATDDTGSEIDKHVVNQVKNYLKQTIGKIGFVCSKKSPNSSGYEARKQAFIEDKKLVLFLSNDHLIDMIMKKYRKEEPSDVMVDLIDEFNINFG
ncbi:MAG: TIR domain-containing protein [Carboxydocellales bacterium]